jgi:hypothetical protein
MNEFIEERAKFVRELASRADPTTKARLLRLAERYERELGVPAGAVREIKRLASLPAAK